MSQYSPNNALPLFSLARTTDPATSMQAAAQLRLGDRLEILASVYRAAGASGLTDEEACEQAGLLDGCWKRCSDLRRLRTIEPTGQTRIASSGRARIVCRITKP